MALGNPIHDASSECKMVGTVPFDVISLSNAILIGLIATKNSEKYFKYFSTSCHC